MLELKKEFKKDTCMLKNALEQVFYHQALTGKRMLYPYSKEKEMDEKISKLDANMTKVMKYQKRQKVTSPENTVISCVPLIGGVLRIG